jgi:hypothetical protein
MSRYIPFIFAFSLFVFSVCGVETGAAESVKLCQSYELWEEWDTLKDGKTEKYEQLKKEHDRTARTVGVPPEETKDTLKDGKTEKHEPLKREHGRPARTVELPPEETKVKPVPPQRTIVDRIKEHYVYAGIFLLLLVWWFISRIRKAKRIKQEEEKKWREQYKQKRGGSDSTELVGFGSFDDDLVLSAVSSGEDEDPFDLVPSENEDPFDLVPSEDEDPFDLVPR